jgi:4-diphosphocytidyl-2-C-methyl-D-erythritol kinase
LKVSAPAKTNLFLEVPCKRPDGFHELDTVFVTLALADTLELESLAGGSLELLVEGAGPDVTAGPENLVHRAAVALREHVGQPELGARIRLQKQIPSGGGLGGGSSNAAAALRGLDALWGLELPPTDLHALAAGLGSDVAFFLEGGLQRGRGRGELLEPLGPCPTLHLVLVLPDFGCPTPRVYSALAPFLPSQPRTADALVAALASGDLERIAAELFNRLEQPARAEFPQLVDLDRSLRAREGVLTTLLSGSGSTLVALAESAAAAERLAAALAAEGQRALATSTEA